MRRLRTLSAVHKGRGRSRRRKTVVRDKVQCEWRVAMKQLKVVAGCKESGKMGKWEQPDDWLACRLPGIRVSVKLSETGTAQRAARGT